MKNRNPKMVALVVTLVVIFVVLPAATCLGMAVSYMNQKARRSVTTVVPDVTGHDRGSAEAALRNARLSPQISFTTINDRCWQEPQVANTVVDQDPKAYSVVSVDTDVRVFVGKNDRNAVAIALKATCCNSP